MPKQKAKKVPKKPPGRPEIPITETCLFKTDSMEKSDEWCSLPIREKRSYVQCYAKRLRTESPKMTFGQSMKKAWDYFRKSCKGGS
jgi:hypothetical protein